MAECQNISEDKYKISEESYKLSIDQVLSIVKGTDQGLTTDEAKARLRLDGPNSLDGANGKRRINYGGILVHQLFNAMIIVLIVSFIIAFAIRDYISGGVIVAVVILNVGVGFYQQLRAEQTMVNLMGLSSSTAHVVRDNGDSHTLDVEEVVLGDLVRITAGDTVPADLRLLDLLNLETNELMLTGESVAMQKNHSVLFEEGEEDWPLGDRVNMVFSGTTVTKGRGTGIVVGTGIHTQIGKIAGSLSQSRYAGLSIFGRIKLFIGDLLGVSKGTALQKKLSWLALTLFAIAVVFAIVVMASQKMRVNREVAVYAICVALSMIPSALIVVLTITMAVGAQAMVKRNVVVRNIESLEVLGGVNDICSDKTGTLTQGKMIVKEVWLSSGSSSLSESAQSVFVGPTKDVFNPTIGELSGAGRDNPALPLFVQTAGLANVAAVSLVNEKWVAHGDATEIALRVFAERFDQYKKEVLDLEYTVVSEFPFESSIKKMTMVVENNATGQITVHTKGAVERVLECCVPDSFDRVQVEAKVNELSSKGLRVLALARRDHQGEVSSNRAQVEANLTFQGLAGIYDPPRVETASSVAKCHDAGIHVRMLTGDHILTAIAIAKEVGIVPQLKGDLPAGMAMTAGQFDKMTDEQIDALEELPLVIARCTPDTKVRMILALHRRNAIVAMTGDGINDSPSLQKADVGVAMGLAGSDVAKDASDIVLADDNFALILNAVEEGRRMLENIKKFVLQLLAANVTQALYLMVGLAFLDSEGYSVFPLSPVEVLWILVATLCFPAIGLSLEKAEGVDLLTEERLENHIFTKELITDMFVYGFWAFVCGICNFVIIIYWKGKGDLGYECNSENANTSVCKHVFEARSSSFSILTWSALILAWECIDFRQLLFARIGERPWWGKLWNNQFLFWSVVIGSLMVFPLVYIPVINTKVMLHKNIGWEWGTAVLFTLVFLVGSEIWKFIKRRVIYKDKQSITRASTTTEMFEKFSKSNTMV